ncbi:hypothetical protein [Geopseudomonas guangdongensis]|uniref:Phage integrase family protein n=1 Tax=Geopseudomonas guangdongensis TaxID=1245526 RepID=A0A1H2EM02_9GAMM|nr:hypothetical protein [Pseudomonas guangdongensis]SDT96146.1 hypothetical protein SAMN05216580_0703 [Pseudomonas guangdongensis]
MSIIAYLQLNQWQQHQLPDSYANESDHLAVGGDFVISRAATGEVVSRYQDNVWNMKMYDARGVCIYDFVSWADGSENPLATVIVEEMKCIQFARMYLFPMPRKPVSLTMSTLRKLVYLSFRNNLSLTQLFESENINRFFLPSFALLERDAMGRMLTFLKEIFEFRVKHPDFTIAPASYEPIKLMQAIYDKSSKWGNGEQQQTKLIPTRIYAAFIAAINSELDAFNEHRDALVAFCRKRKENPRFGVSEARMYLYKEGVVWSDLVSLFGLRSLFEKYSIADGADLRKYVGEIQCAAKYWIHFFSGMRDNEARCLPADAYQTIEMAGADFSILRGYTSKVAGQNQTETFWITTPAAEKAVVAARCVGEITALWNDLDYTDLSKSPLFPSLKFSNDYREFKCSPVAGGRAMLVRKKRLFSRWPEIIVQEADIRELEQFDGFRDWRNDPDVQIGQPWPLATHQCRRSLAVYAARSGMVSVGSLGLQFKHLTEVMTSYYRKGSAFAVNFLQTDEAQGWMEELECERLKSQYINYEANVINSASRLWGGEGNRIQVARDKGQPLIITTDRAMTEKKFLKGEMVYKIGPIGGCTNLEPCDKISFTSIFACMDCENSILDDDRSLKNIRRGLDNLKREKSLFAVENPQYKQLESEISAIYEKLEKTGLLEKMEAMA